MILQVVAPGNGAWEREVGLRSGGHVRGCNCGSCCVKRKLQGEAHGVQKARGSC